MAYWKLCVSPLDDAKRRRREVVARSLQPRGIGSWRSCRNWRKLIDLFETSADDRAEADIVGAVVPGKILVDGVDRDDARRVPVLVPIRSVEAAEPFVVAGQNAGGLRCPRA